MLSDEHTLLRDTLRDFAQQRLAPNAADWDRNATFPKAALAELAALGTFGIAVPDSYGGAGMDYLALALALEEIAAGDGATSTIVSVQNSVVCGPIAAFGTDAQKEHYLKPLARGEWLGCFCLTEPQVGSDAGAITTRADRAAGHYVLNGVKQFITTGKHAEVAIVFAVTDPAAGKRGISAFIVETGAPDHRAGFVVARGTAWEPFNGHPYGALSEALRGPSCGTAFQSRLRRFLAGRTGLAFSEPVLEVGPEIHDPSPKAG